MSKQRFFVGALILICLLTGFFLWHRSVSSAAASESEKVISNPPMDFEFKDKLLSEEKMAEDRKITRDPEPKKKAESNSLPEAKTVTRKNVKEKRAPSRDSYFLQTSSFRLREQAEEERSRLKKDFFPVEITAVDLGDKGVWYRVIIGPVSQKKMERFSKKLADEFGIKPLIRKNR
ncbi:SPOR domain-containing protein [bacterium]|nr:SPOR domain-containing protein [bacterium]